MTKREPTDCLEDILKYSGDMLAISRDLSREEFDSNIEKQYALLRCLEVVGEAAKRLLSIAPDFRDKYAEIDWKKVMGMRDILIHHYEQANMDIVWQTIKKDVPHFEKAIRKILLTESKKSS